MYKNKKIFDKHIISLKGGMSYVNLNRRSSGYDVQ